MQERDFFNEFIKKPKVEFVKSTLERSWEAGVKPAIEVAVYDQDSEIMVPAQFVKAGRITLIMGAADIRDYHFDESKGVIHFSASFSGRPTSVVVPVSAIIAMVVDHKVLGVGFPSWIDSQMVEEPQEAQVNEAPASDSNVVSLFNGPGPKH